MRSKPRSVHLVAVKLNDQQISMLDDEVERRRSETSEELRVTRSSVLRYALVELTKRHAS